MYHGNFSGWCCGTCQTEFREIPTDGNLYGAVSFGLDWYLTRYPVNGWDIEWFEVSPDDGEIVPDFVSKNSHILVPNLEYDDQTYRCVGVSGSQFADASSVPGLLGDSCVYYQLNFAPISNLSAPPIAGLARVIVRDDTLSGQLGSPTNSSFELSHCWILEDENGDPWKFDEPSKLCNHHDVNIKTCVGPGHFVYQYLRVGGPGGNYRLRYWTPGVTQAVLSEWDNPNTTVNTSGWKALYYDKHCFPVALGTKVSTIDITPEVLQSASRYFKAGMGNPDSGVVTAIDQWSEDVDENGPEVAIGYTIYGEGGGWADLTYPNMSVEMIDWRVSASMGGFQLYYPDDLDENYPIYAYGSITADDTGRFHMSWAGYSYQYSEVLRIQDGILISVEGESIDPLCVKGIASANSGNPHVFDAVPTGGDNQFRIYNSTCNGNQIESSSRRAVTRSSTGALEDGLDYSIIGNPMYGSSQQYVFVGDEEYRTGISGIQHAYSSGDNTVSPLWGGENISFHEDEIGWFLQNIPAGARWLIRRSFPFNPTEDYPDLGDGGEWPIWIVKLAHSTTTPISPYDGWTRPTMFRAMYIDDGEDGILVSVRAKYWDVGGAEQTAPLESFCYAGTKTISDEF